VTPPAAPGRPLWAEPHHDGAALTGPGGPVALGDAVEVRLRVPHGGTGESPVAAVHVRWLSDAEPRYARAEVERVDDHDVWFRARIAVRNPLTRYRWLLDDGPGAGYRWVTAAGVHAHDVTDVHDHVLSTFPAAPDWAVDGVVYQVFPDRFARSGDPLPRPPDWAVPADWDDPPHHGGPDSGTQWFGGDLRGVAAHLDHLGRLGVTVLYLTPVFPAGSTHRYDAVAFDRVDPLLGGDEALAELVRAAHARGIRVLGDLTTNHTGAGHEWFRTARDDPDAPEGGFYYLDGEGGYEAWFGIPELPKLDHSSPELAARLVDGPDSVVGRWLAGPDGFDGWRIDVANMTGRRGAEDHNHRVARTVRRTMDAVKPGSFLVAEHFHDASPDVTVGAGGWDSVMNYAGFLRPVWEWLADPDCRYDFLGLPVRIPRKPTADVVAALRVFGASVPWQQQLQNLTMLGSHDTPRPLSVFGSVDRLLAGAAMLVGYPGIPMVFAGDELGLTGDDGEHSRTPMPWGDAGRFDGPVLAAYRDLLRLRRSSEALRRGGMRWCAAGADAMAWLRETPAERVLVVVARGAGTVTLPVSLVGRPGAVRWVWGEPHPAVVGGELTVRFDGAGALFLSCAPPLDPAGGDL
jgi:alpha-glucosidase